MERKKEMEKMKREKRKDSWWKKRVFNRNRPVEGEKYKNLKEPFIISKYVKNKKTPTGWNKKLGKKVWEKEREREREREKERREMFARETLKAAVSLLLKMEWGRNFGTSLHY
jgi:hypothetical protein